MILILSDTTDPQGAEYRQLMESLERLPNIKPRVHRIQGTERAVTEVYLLGDTKALSVDDMKALPCVERVIRVSEEFRVLGRHKDDDRPTHFDYQGLRFGQDTLHIFAGLCAVDTPAHVDIMMRALKDNGQQCTRMGAYKPRTSPYAFQGHGKNCLPYVFESSQWRSRTNRMSRRFARRCARPAIRPASCCRSVPATPRISNC